MQTTETHNSLAAALDTYKPAIAARHVAAVTEMFEAILAAFGPTLRGVSNSFKWAKTYSNVVARYVTSEGNSFHAPHFLNTARLEADAVQYADEVAQAWQIKIEAKLGELESGTVHHMDGVAFRIVGTRGGHAVEIEQTMILNVSSRGTLFHQFPARIYVDGKFKSEAAYKKMFQAAEAA